jgi:hypothetical protein
MESHRADSMTSSPPGTPPPPSVQTLTDALLDTVDLIRRRRCSEIAEGYVDAYVALNWMEWNGGSLRLTVTGDNIRRRLAAGQVRDWFGPDR